MADRKISELTALTTANDEDLLVIVDDPNGTPTSKKITVKSLFGAVPSNTVHTQRVTAQANLTHTGTTANLTSNLNVTGISTLNQLKVANDNSFIVRSMHGAPGSNNANLEFGVTDNNGRVFFSNSFMYVCVANTVIKRVALSVF